MKKFILFSLICALHVLSAHAQSLATTVQQIKDIHNSSYTDILKFKFSFQDNLTIDTLKVQSATVLTEPQIGGYYRVEGNKDVYLFDGSKTIWLNLHDTTYKLGNNANGNQYTRGLLYWRKQMESYLKTPSKIKPLSDTVINHTTYNHFLITRQDTVENKEHLYDFVDVIINKTTSLPYLIRWDVRTLGDDKVVIGLFEEHTFHDYQINKSNFTNLSDAMVPENFKLPVTKQKTFPLTIGTKAPTINLYGMAGDNLNLEDLKGKIILLNFTSIGCPHCVNAATMLTQLYERYKSTDFAIISIYRLDYNDKKAIARFDSKYGIKYPSYTTEKSAEDIYHLQGYPHFYLLDKQGNIAQSNIGFYAGLDKELTNKIESIK